MAREVTMPQLGFTMVEGTVSAWLKREGEVVNKGEALLEVTTDKVTSEVEAPTTGVLTRILVPEGSVVPVGTPVGLLSAAEEAAVTAQPGSQPVAAAPQLASSRESGPVVPPEAALAEAEEPIVKASPVAKRLARDHGIDLTTLAGTGPGGRIVEADVLRFLESGAQVAKTPAPDQASSPETSEEPTISMAPSVAAREPVKRVPLKGVRRVIAERMMRSTRETAHVTLVAEVDATEAVRLREQLLAEWETADGARLTITDLVVRACAKALGEHPALNATVDGEDIVYPTEVNVGVAVALTDGLIVPVLRQVDVNALRQIAKESRDLVERARNNNLGVDEVTGGTFTVTNLGSYGVDLFTPIINPPETAILGVGRIAERAAVYGGKLCKRHLMYLSLTFDHRLVDGAPAALFLARLRELLEKPYLLLV